MAKFGIIGNGFVGRATQMFSSEQWEAVVYDIDPKLCVPKGTELSDLKECSVVFICVPTPEALDGTCDTSIVDRCITSLKEIGVSEIIVRSTVPVGYCESKKVNFLPEFLTERNWQQDVKNTKYWILGKVNYNPKILDIFQNILKHSGLNGTITICNTTEAEMVKYTRNTFLATKVSFFNEIFKFLGCAGLILM